MWGQWGRYYWGRKEEGAVGIVVVFAWMSSEERHVKQYVNLYGSLGWNSLVCHADFLNMFFPDKAVLLALGVLNEILKEIKIKRLPIVFAAFSGGPKACMYKVLQVMEGKCERKLDLGDCKIVKDCFCGQIYDSSPVDFTSDIGTRFVLHPSVLKRPQPPRVLSWMAKTAASGLDALFLNRFEAQREEYWQTLYSSVDTGPFLVFCSEEDELAPYPIINNFVQRLLELGGDVKLVKWSNSPHVGHYKLHPEDYRTDVTELLRKAYDIYFNRAQHNDNSNSNSSDNSKGCNRIAKSIFDLHKVAMGSNESLRKVAVSPSDHFFLPSSLEYHEAKDGGSVKDEQKGGLFDSENPPGIDAHGVLGKILFDVCVPRNVEGWDIKSVGLKMDNRRNHFNPIKLIRRSKL